MARNHWDAYALTVAREVGHQWRRRYLGDPDPLGYPPRALLGKLMEEGVHGAGQSAFVQVVPEFYTGDALLGRRCMRLLREQDHIVLMVHFCGKGLPNKLKSHALGWKGRTYDWRLARAMDHFAKVLRTPEWELRKVFSGGLRIEPSEYAMVA